jgi:hypothetical protein
MCEWTAYHWHNGFEWVQRGEAEKRIRELQDRITLARRADNALFTGYVPAILSGNVTAEHLRDVSAWEGGPTIMELIEAIEKEDEKKLR